MTGGNASWVASSPIPSPGLPQGAGSGDAWALGHGWRWQRGGSIIDVVGDLSEIPDVMEYQSQAPLQACLPYTFTALPLHPDPSTIPGKALLGYSPTNSPLSAFPAKSRQHASTNKLPSQPRGMASARRGRGGRSGRRGRQRSPDERAGNIGEVGTGKGAGVLEVSRHDDDGGTLSPKDTRPKAALTGVSFVKDETQRGGDAVGVERVVAAGVSADRDADEQMAGGERGESDVQEQVQAGQGSVVGEAVKEGEEAPGERGGDASRETESREAERATNSLLRRAFLGGYGLRFAPRDCEFDRAGPQMCNSRGDETKSSRSPALSRSLSPHAHSRPLPPPPSPFLSRPHNDAASLAVARHQPQIRSCMLSECLRWGLCARMGNQEEGLTDE